MDKDTKLIKQVLKNLQKLNEKKKVDGTRSVKKGADNNPNVTKMDFLPDKVLNKIAKNKKNKNETLEDVLESFINLEEKKGSITDYQSDKYGMKKKGKGKREKVQRRINKKLSQGKKLTKADYEARDAAEKAEREKPGWKNKPRPDSQSAKNETVSFTKKDLIFLIEQELNLDEKKKKKKKSTLSKKTKETLKKKAQAKGYTPGSVYQEYRKGLGAYYSSGSRKGMSAHQWAMARVNSAMQGGKSWACVKKSGAKKK